MGLKESVFSDICFRRNQLKNKPIVKKDLCIVVAGFFVMR